MRGTIKPQTLIVNGARDVKCRILSKEQERSGLYWQACKDELGFIHLWRNTF